MACWGYNDLGGASPPAGTFSSVSGGGYHGCGIRADASIACWGYNFQGQSSAPAGTFVAVAAGNTHSCAIASGGSLSCWGESFGPLPSGSFVALSTKQHFSCGIRSDGTLGCWGYGPVQEIPPSGAFIDLGVGVNHSCGVRDDGSLACWGYSVHGVLSPPSGSFLAVSTGYEHNCAIRADNTLACWGKNIGTPPTGTFSEVTSGWDHSCALRTDGTLACWGANGYGQAPRLAVTPASLPNTATGASYGTALALSNTVSSFAGYAYVPPSPAFAVVSGQLPPGLSLSAAGLLAGTPTSGGTYAFAIEGEDANGFTATRSFSVFVDGPTDTTPPTISAVVTGPNGDNGWHIGDVIISWSVTDVQSGIAFSSGCNTSTLASDSAGATFTCTATSTGGTSSESVTVKRDATAPTLAPEVTPGIILVGGSGTTSANATDALSGIATQGCEAVDTATVGGHESTCTASDNAGNTASATIGYVVIYGFVGFGPPVDNPPAVNIAKAGRTIPFKWRLVDSSGTPIASLAGATLHAISVGCDGSSVADEMETYAVGGTAFHNLGDGNYQYNWQSPTSYQGTCKKIVLDLSDGSTRFALFQFR